MGYTEGIGANTPVEATPDHINGGRGFQVFQSAWFQVMGLALVMVGGLIHLVSKSLK